MSPYLEQLKKICKRIQRVKRINGVDVVYFFCTQTFTSLYPLCPTTKIGVVPMSSERSWDVRMNPTQVRVIVTSKGTDWDPCFVPRCRLCSHLIDFLSFCGGFVSNDSHGANSSVQPPACCPDVPHCPANLFIRVPCFLSVFVRSFLLPSPVSSLRLLHSHSSDSVPFY